MKPTEEDLKRDAAADLAVCEAASPGPWIVSHSVADDCECHYCNVVSGPNHRTPAHCYGTGPYRRHDSAFIAASRDALPAWIRRAEALQAENKELRAEVERLKEKKCVHVLAKEWAESALTPHFPPDGSGKESP